MSGKAPLVSYVAVFGHSTLQTAAKDTVVFKRSGITIQDYGKHRAHQVTPVFLIPALFLHRYHSGLWL